MYGIIRKRIDELLQKLDEIDKAGLDATTTAMAQILAVQECWKGYNIDWLELTKRSSRTALTRL